MNKSLEIIKEYKLEYYLDCLLKYNSGNINYYHNYEHTMVVLKNVYDISKTYPTIDEYLRELFIVAIFHDFNHTGGRLKNDSENIIRAIEAFDKFTVEDNVSNIRIKNTIRATEYPFKNEELDILQKIIRDADVMQWLEPDYTQHVLLGLNGEFHNSSEITIELIQNSLDFMKSVEFFTEYTKNQMKQYLPEKIEELEYLITILKNNK